MNPREEEIGPFALNPTALVEYAYGLFRLVYEVLVASGFRKMSLRVAGNGEVTTGRADAHRRTARACGSLRVPSRSRKRGQLSADLLPKCAR
jgi:hypothetical protein